MEQVLGSVHDFVMFQLHDLPSYVRNYRINHQLGLTVSRLSLWTFTTNKFTESIFWIDCVINQCMGMSGNGYHQLGQVLVDRRCELVCANDSHFPVRCTLTFRYCERFMLFSFVSCKTYSLCGT